MGQVITLRIGSYFFKLLAFLTLVILMVRGIIPMTQPGAEAFVSLPILIVGLIVIPGPFFLIGVLLDTIANMTDSIDEMQEQIEDTNKRVIWLQKKLNAGADPKA